MKYDLVILLLTVPVMFVFYWLYFKISLFNTLVSFLGATSVFYLVGWRVSCKFYEKISKLSSVNPSKKGVFITGCDTGFGFETALRLNKRGFRIYAGCLFPNGQGAKDLKAQCRNPDNMVIVPIDVAKQESIDQAFDFINEDLKSVRYELWALINNAGIGSFGCVEWGPFSETRQLFDVNVFGLMMVTRTFLPLLRESRGRVVLLASASARLMAPYLTEYSLTKRTVLALGDALRFELSYFGIDVITIDPSFASTNIVSAETFTKGVTKTFLSSSKEIRKAYKPQIQGSIIFGHLSHGRMDELKKIYARTLDYITDSIALTNPSLRFSPISFNTQLAIAVWNILPKGLAAQALLSVMNYLKTECEVCTNCEKLMNQD